MLHPSHNQGMPPHRTKKDNDGQHHNIGPTRAVIYTHGIHTTSNSTNKIKLDGITYTEVDLHLNGSRRNRNKMKANTRKKNTERWATTIITTIWHGGFLNLWKPHKKAQHGRDVVQLKEEEKETYYYEEHDNYTEI
jgi:hypothetical protein